MRQGIATMKPKKLETMKGLFAKLLVLLPVFVVCASFFCLFKKSGIEGDVYRISGNQMPSPDRPPAAPVPLQTMVYIYELTNINQVRRDGQTAFYASVNTKPVTQVQSNAKGHFKVKLPPGKYSLFLKTEQGFYSNRFDSQNNISPVEVIKKKMSKVELRLDNTAAY